MSSMNKSETRFQRFSTLTSEDTLANCSRKKVGCEKDGAEKHVKAPRAQFPHLLVHFWTAPLVGIFGDQISLLRRHWDEECPRPPFSANQLPASLLNHHISALLFKSQLLWLNILAHQTATKISTKSVKWDRPHSRVGESSGLQGFSDPLLIHLHSEDPKILLEKQIPF